MLPTGLPGLGGGGGSLGLLGALPLLAGGGSSMLPFLFPGLAGGAVQGGSALLGRLGTPEGRVLVSAAERFRSNPGARPLEPKALCLFRRHPVPFCMRGFHRKTVVGKQRSRTLR